MSDYIKYHPRYINGKPRNETGRLSEDELAAMASQVSGKRNTDGLTRKERRAAYVRERKAIQDALRLDGKR